MIHLTAKTYSLAAAIDHAAAKNPDCGARWITADQTAALAEEHDAPRGRVRDVAAALGIRAEMPPRGSRA